MTRQYNIAVLLPSRARTQALEKSLRSIVDHCQDTNRIQILIGFDDDDDVGKNYFLSNIRDWLESTPVAYTAMEFPRLGYEHLNVYYNKLADGSDADWLFAWNDDAIMETQSWDQEILKYSGQVKLLRVQTHRNHPYSIFPIWPRVWYDVWGFGSRHQMIDAELSQVAYLLDIMQNIDVTVTHDRYDLTGNNLDDTQKNKKTLEGNPSDPRDFHNRDQVLTRYQNCKKLAQYLESNGHDMSFWKAVLEKKQDPWQKLKANDPNKLTVISNIKP